MSDSTAAFIPDLLALMPLSAREVLLCAAPELARAYRMRNPAARLTGFGAAHAPERDAGPVGAFDRFLTGDPGTISKTRLAVPGLGYDLVVLDGTLGLLRDPAALLRRLHGLMRSGGHLVIANRNAAHWADLARLIGGQQTVGGGLTQDRMNELLTGSGFSTRRMRARRPAASGGEAGTWLAALGGLAGETGLEAEPLRKRLTASHFVMVAIRRDAEAEPPPPLRLHQLELARGMDVRTRIPAEALTAEPALSVVVHRLNLTLPPRTPEGGVVVVQRPRISDPQRVLDFVAECQRRGYVVVVEYDDDPALVARVLKRRDEPGIHLRNLALAHAVQTSTEVLARQFSATNPEVVVFHNAAEDLAPLRRHQPGPLRVLFAALNRTRTDEMAALLAPAIAALPDLEFDVVHDRDFFEALPAPNKRFHDLLGYRDYLALLGQCDVALMPLEGLPEELGKSDVKWVEAASRGAIAIASPPVYGQTIRHGQTGFLARNRGDWSRLLIALGRDPARRNRVAAAARAEVAASRMMAGQVARRRDWYLDLHARRAQLFADALRRSPALAERLGSG